MPKKVLCNLFNISLIISCFFPIFIEQLKTIYYILPISLITIGLSFNNISILTDYLHEKAVIYTDLIDESEPSIDKKNKFQKVYLASLYIFSSILISTLIYYFYFELEYSVLNKFEILAFVGGWISLVRRTHIAISDGLLILIHKYKTFIKKSKVTINNDLKKENELNNIV